MATVYPEHEIRGAFDRYDALLEKLEFEQAIEMFTPDAQGGNAVFGIFPGKRDGIRQFMSANPEDWGYETIWSTIDRNFVRYQCAELSFKKIDALIEGTDI